jgi:hypothetical protein
VDLRVIQRVVDRYITSAAKTYRFNRAEWARKVRSLNSPRSREDQQKLLGGYSVYHLALVPLTEIEIPSPWNQGRLANALRGIEEGKELPPVDLAKQEGSSKWAIGDGIHRTNASLQKGFTHVPAITEEWVPTPEKQAPEEPEKPLLAPGTWVKLKKRFEGSSYGWVVEHLGYTMENGVKRHRYNLALVKAGDEYPDHMDARDTLFDVTRPPPWALKAKALIGR